ncbi:MAG TPA: biotin/lipoyl-containing protein, partial [Thioalkalivibrio sp.]|nr:biotin/lipoyl-containing protein [Thioalkalivibrio sp.]
MSNVVEVKVPDIGDFKDVEIIELLVKPGDSVKAEDPLITLESDKVTIDIPSPGDGVIKALKVKKGDQVSQGDHIIDMETDGAAAGEDKSRDEPKKTAPEASQEKAEPKVAEPKKPQEDKSEAEAPPAKPAGPRPSPTAGIVNEDGFRKAHASPAVRKFA